MARKARPASRPRPARPRRRRACCKRRPPDPGDCDSSATGSARQSATRVRLDRSRSRGNACKRCRPCRNKSRSKRAGFAGMSRIVGPGRSVETVGQSWCETWRFAGVFWAVCTTTAPHQATSYRGRSRDAARQKRGPCSLGPRARPARQHSVRPALLCLVYAAARRPSAGVPADCSIRGEAEVLTCTPACRPFRESAEPRVGRLLPAGRRSPRTGARRRLRL